MNVDEATIKAMEIASELKTTDEVGQYFEILATMSIAAIRGAQGNKFVEGFLTSALNDKSPPVIKTHLNH